ncbi:MAG: hypothetical protein IJP10_03680 [Clostridia bacterium]|nr:hypothetical protein [Oscillospiraceae bacterium]MBQ6797095.1 hypothetical protein [Clostridia bacterium]
MKFQFRPYIKMISSLLAALLLLMTAAGCSEGESSLSEREALREELYGTVELPTGDEEVTQYDATTSNFTIAYSKSDAINPYFCTSALNMVMGDLMYDSLLTVNSEFEADMVIAQSVTQLSGRIYQVTLRSGVVFSDGTPVTGHDVKYSFELAKLDTSRFKPQLASITSCVSTDTTATFRIEKLDPRAYMLLDFPIVKQGSADTKDHIPIGSGRFYYHSDPETGTYLLRNERWYNPNIPTVNRISLVTMPTVESIIHSIEIGTVSYYFTDLRDGYPSRVNSNYAMVDLNNLVYLGINTHDPRLQNSDVRHAISYALNREELASSAFSGRAYAATGPLTTSWPEAAAAQYGSTLSSEPTAISSLITAGYVNQDDNYIRYSANGTSRLSFDLLVNGDNDLQVAAAQSIAQQLRKVGISIKISQAGYADFRARVAAGNYQLYLGEYALLNNMDFSMLFTPGKGYYAGPTPTDTINAYNNYIAGNAELSDVMASFESDLPFIPLCYRLGMVCYTRSLNANMDVTESDFFLNMHLWQPTLAQAEKQE